MDTIPLNTVRIPLHDSFREYGLPISAILNQIYGKYKARAKKLGIEFSLSEKEFVYLCSGNCVFCGCRPSNKFTYNGFSFFYSGIDRKSHAGGYVFDNCSICCWTCNKMKHLDDDFSFFMRMADISDNFQCEDAFDTKLQLWQKNIKTFLDKNGGTY